MTVGTAASSRSVATRLLLVLVGLYQAARAAPKRSRAVRA